MKGCALENLTGASAQHRIYKGVNITQAVGKAWQMVDKECGQGGGSLHWGWGCCVCTSGVTNVFLHRVVNKQNSSRLLLWLASFEYKRIIQMAC